MSIIFVKCWKNNKNQNQILYQSVCHGQYNFKLVNVKF